MLEILLESKGSILGPKTAGMDEDQTDQLDPEQSKSCLFFGFVIEIQTIPIIQ